MPNYTRAVYDHLRTLGDVGDEVRAAIHPYLIVTFGLAPDEASRVRSKAMQELQKRGMVRRLNTRGPYVQILAEYYPDPWLEPDGKFVDNGLRPVE